MNDLEEFTKIKKLCEQAQREVNRSEGAIEQLSIRIKNEFACTVEEAKELLKKLEKEASSSQKAYRDELQKIKSDYGDRLKLR